MMYVCAIASGIITGVYLSDLLPLGGYTEIASVFSSILFFFIALGLIFRFYMRFFSFPCGYIEQHSREEALYHIYLMFYLLGFNTLTCSRFLPMPIMRLVYIGLGAKMGENSFTGGTICEPHLVTIGKNCLLGLHSVLVPHQIENEKLSHEPIVIGDNVTIGAHVVVFQGTVIGNNALVGAGSVVRKGTRIGDNEIWGGVPAKFIKKKDEQG